MGQFPVHKSKAQLKSRVDGPGTTEGQRTEKRGGRADNMPGQAAASLQRLAATVKSFDEDYAAAFDDITKCKEAKKTMRMFVQEFAAARDEERKQVSSALHHDVGSLAVGISAYLDAMEEDLRSGRVGEVLTWVKRTRKLFDKSVVRLKALAVELRPPELDVLGLRAALRQYFSQITSAGAARVYFRETQGENRLSASAATILFRVAQEAVTNAIKHGRAKQVNVDLRTAKDEIRLTVRDNGKGFDPSDRRTRAMRQLGFRVMRGMAASAGGAFTIDSRPGEGTTVRLRLPIETTDLRMTGAVAREEPIRSAIRSSRARSGRRT